ncbi:MFS transporter [Nocardioides iriomotensis]|uniref:MFS transporter n=1 Tax=Nocardioides iriomotensis TaxID=715784 RepID=A0A4Q5J4J3_9ACTN|nr:MFS transporter [Nocardioides iriomotensis]RYU13454.1 MFS transporter [Nocardioides iriomotensis]
MTSRSRLVSVLRQRRDLRLLLAANVVSLCGDWVLGIGIAYAVYDLTGSTLASAGSLLAAFLPQVLVGPVAGVLVDRWDRRRTMVGANLAMALAVLPLVLVGDASTVWLLYPLLVLQSVVEVFFAPAEQAFLPRLVPDDELVTANALNAQAGQVARLVGGALGGVAAAAGGIPAVALLDVATFLVSALLISRIRTSGRVPAEPEGADAVAAVERRLTRFRTELVEGLQVVRGSRVLVVVLVFALITSTGEGIMGTLFAPFVNDVLGGSGQAYGVISGSQAIGGIVGGLVAASIGHRLSPVLLLGAGAMVFGAVDLAIFLYPLALGEIWWPAVLGMVLVGLPGALTMAGYTTLFQRATADASRGRAFSLVALCRTVAVLVGTTLAGFLGEQVGILPVLAFQGVGYVVAGAMVLLVLRASDGQARDEASRASSSGRAGWRSGSDASATSTTSVS